MVMNINLVHLCFSLPHTVVELGKQRDSMGLKSLHNTNKIPLFLKEKVDSMQLFRQKVNNPCLLDPSI